MYVYLLWDGTNDWGSNPKVELHSIHLTEESAKKTKEKQHLNGDCFYIEKRIVTK